MRKLRQPGHLKAIKGVLEGMPQTTENVVKNTFEHYTHGHVNFRHLHWSMELGYL